jgi:hypothetical protein
VTGVQTCALPIYIVYDVFFLMVLTLVISTDHDINAFWSKTV